MKVARIHICGWTASFRYPTFVSGFQPSLPVPPLSTVYGLLSAARGEIVTPNQTAVGFIFQSKGKAVDLETIYELQDTALQAKSNVIRREILFEPEMFIYLPDLNFAEYFKTPAYPLLLGRSTELVMVRKIETIELLRKENVRVGGSIFPFSPELKVSGKLQALPTHFTAGMPRLAVGTQPFCLVETDFSGKSLNLRPQIYVEEIYCDTEKDWGVYFHGGSFSEK
jgi:CRISPR-associated protein Cas5t